MRTNILLMGAVISAAGFLLLLYNLGTGIFTAPAGIVNIIVGVVTGKSAGVTTSETLSNGPRVLVDKGVVRASIYQLALFDRKLVLKKLASANVTIIMVIILFLVGLFLEGGGLIGGLSGGLTGYSLQEFVTQRNRDRIRKQDALSRLGPGDLEFGYDDLEKVRLRGSSMLVFTKTGVLRVSLSRGYATKMRPVLERLLGDKYETEPSQYSAGS